ncbi:MAG: hypothetical protein AABO41_16880 [Acidobacteriota bacterium]
MSTDNRDVLEVLKAELNFIEKGGYGKPAGEPWVSTSIFQDSPSCLNLGDPTRSHSCSECLLIDFVPPGDRGKAVPCHHIPLTEAGATVESIEATGDQQQLEGSSETWLRNTIARIELARAPLHAG